MREECHDETCNRLNFTSVHCECGFIQRLISGQASVTSANRGKGGKEVYVAKNNDGANIFVSMIDVDGFLAALKEKCASLPEHFKEY